MVYARNMSIVFPLNYLTCTKNIPTFLENPKYAELLYHMDCKKC